MHALVSSALPDQAGVTVTDLSTSPVNRANLLP
ncbi:MAG: hypothetical protein QOE61_799, partial [Micromonosporaceae bacterium]|nr:hypothetical protein [Micromonosporaceae bacterium]